MYKNIKKIIPYALKRLLGRSKLFWSLRSKFTGKGIWLAYAKNYLEDRRGFFSSFVEKHGCTTILDYGCASGPNLLRIEKDVKERKFFFLGIDISNDAIAIAKNKIKSNAKFSRYLTSENILQLSKQNTEGIVDLAIFDRVLTILDKKDLINLFQIISKHVRYLIIDDFLSEQEFQDKVWLARNYEELLKEYGYKIIIKKKSEHKITSKFHSKYAYLLVFEKNS
jgi:SAM-dependent methyltransferase